MQSKFPSSHGLTGDALRRHDDAVARRIASHFGRSDLPGQLDHGLGTMTQGEQIDSKGAQILRPAVPQKPCDHGLFSDDAKQIDLEDLL